MTPSVSKRLLSLVYELLLLVAMILFAGGIATAIAQFTNPTHSRILSQLLVTTVCFGYFTWQWHHKGQTLPMKTWRIRLETADGARASFPRALLRAALSAIGYGLFGISVLWAFIDRDRQFLHDRLAGTRLVVAG